MQPSAATHSRNIGFRWSRSKLGMLTNFPMDHRTKLIANKSTQKPLFLNMNTAIMADLTLINPARLAVDGGPYAFDGFFAH